MHTRGSFAAQRNSCGPPADNNTEESKDIPDIFTCNLCGAKACVTCDLPYHEGETCKEFQQRTQNSNNEASLLLIETACKKCPKCTFSIEKNGGCDTMFCESKNREAYSIQDWNLC